MDLEGALLYFAFIFLPGIGIGEILQLFGNRGSLIERIALSFGLGLCADTLVLAVKTSGLKVLPSGIDVGLVEAIAVTGAILILASVALRKRFTFPIRPKPIDGAVLGCMAVLAALILVYLQKYPIFPEYESYDFTAHLGYVQGLITGQVTSVPAGLLYYGMHFQLAASYLASGGNILEDIGQTVGVLVVLSTLAFYFVGLKLFGSAKVALVLVVLYVFSGAIWFVGAFNAGLYANFFGILISVFVLGLVVELQRDWSRKGLVALLFCVPTVYFSHYTSITILAPLLVMPLLQLVSKRKLDRRSLVPVAVVLAPLLIGLISVGTLLSTLNAVVHSGTGNFFGGTYLSGLLSQIPVLSYMSAEYLYDLGFVLMWLFVAVYCWKVARSPVAPALIPLIWFMALLATSPFGGAIWRWSYEALVPFTLMAAFGISALVPELKKGKKGRVVSGSYWRAGGVLVLMVGLTVAGAWGETMASDATSSTTLVSSSQQSVYDAIVWLGSNTPSNSSYLSVSDWRFLYTLQLIGRTTNYQPESNPSEALALLNHTSTRYIIVTELTTESLPPDPSLYPWNNFPANSTSTLSLIFTNDDVRIYQIGG